MDPLGNLFYTASLCVELFMWESGFGVLGFCRVTTVKNQLL